MKKYEPIKGRIVLSEEEVKLLREAEKIISEVADFVDEYAHDTYISIDLNDLNDRLDNFCKSVEATRGKLTFDISD